MVSDAVAEISEGKRSRQPSGAPVRLPTPPAGEVEELVVKLAKGGNPPSMIGTILRDQYGIPSIKASTGKGAKQILEAHGIKRELPEDLMSLIRKAVALRRHLDKNRMDTRSRRSLEIVEGRINRLVRFYTRTGKLPAGWRYEPEKAALLVG